MSQLFTRGNQSMTKVLSPPSPVTIPIDSNSCFFLKRIARSPSNAYMNHTKRFLQKSLISRFLDKKFSSAPPTLHAKKTPLYRVIPYFGRLSVKMKIELSFLILEYFPHIDIHIILVNRFKVQSFFKFKDSQPCALRSGIVYK